MPRSRYENQYLEDITESRTRGTDYVTGFEWFHEGQDIELVKKTDPVWDPDRGYEREYIDVTAEGTDWWTKTDLDETAAAQQETHLQQYETWWIDSMYGTDNRAWVWRADPGSRSVSQEAQTGQVSELRGKPKATWGLDIVRAAWDYGGDVPEVGTAEHYEWVTRGQVDWAYYQESEEYNKAWDMLVDKGDGEYDVVSGSSDWDKGDWESGFWTKTTEQDRIHFIREANALIESGELEGVDDFWTEWDNMYTSTYIHESHVGTDIEIGGVMTTITEDMVGTARDPEAAYTYEPTALFEPSTMETKVAARLEAAKSQETTHPAITVRPKTPSAVTSKPDINIQTVQIKRPANIPAAWGEV